MGDATQPIRYRIEMFGGLRIRDGERLIAHFKTYKTGALLAYLAYHARHEISREWLFEMLWPEQSVESQARARNNLSAALSALRADLEPSGTLPGTVIIADRHRVRLNVEAITTDVSEFSSALQSTSTANVSQMDEEAKANQFSAAVALYSGSLLPGYYEDWIQPERERLTESYLQALRGLVRYHAKHRELPKAIEYAQCAVSADPIREEAHQDLIRLFLATGQISAARQQYHEMEATLKQALGEQPTPTSRQLLREIESRQQATPPTAPTHSESTAANQQTSTQTTTQQNSATTEPPDAHAPILTPQFTPFFGRERELERLLSLLQMPTVRLITLFGMGGIGKTRLALEVRSKLVSPSETLTQDDPDQTIPKASFPGGIWFVPLADISSASHITGEIAKTLRLTPVPGGDPLDQIVTALRKGPSLLILDNFESFVENGTSLVSSLLARIPDLVLLVTSRQLLRLTGESEFRLDPMDVPAPEADPLLIERCESVRLFVNRAQLARPEFALSPINIATVAALCSRLEGLPLAIELAAARSGILTPEQMLRQLEDRFRLLVSRKQDVVPRHRTLRATLEWSHALLEPETRAFFENLSVFSGGWTLEAAETICKEPFALDALTRLRECSLIETAEVAGQIRFRLLDTMREFVLLHVMPENHTRHKERHFEYYLGIAELLQPCLERSDQESLKKLDAEQENLRAALTFTRIERSDAERCLRLANALLPYWKQRGRYREGREALSMATDTTLPVSPKVRATALHGAGTLALLQGDYASAEPTLENCLRVWQDIVDQAGMADAQTNLGILAARQGRIDAATDRFEAAMALLRELEEWVGVADAMVWLGNLAQQNGDRPRAQSLYEESLSLYQRHGAFARCPTVMGNLGTLAHEAADSERALRYYDTCLKIHRQSENRASIARTQNNRGNALRETGRLEEAVEALQESLELWRKLENNAEIAMTLNTLGMACCAQQNYQEARRCFAESWMLSQQRSDRVGLGYTLMGAAHIALAEAHPEVAARLLGQCQREHIGAKLQLPASDLRDWERIVQGTRALLNDAEFERAYQIGLVPPLPAELSAVTD